MAQVDEFIDWKPIEKQLKKQYRRTQNVVGNAAYPALPMFKALLLQRWYDLSDPGLEEALYDRVSFIRFCGFQMSGPRPDETTFCRFRGALMEARLFERLFKILNQQLEGSGLIVKQGAIVVATLVQSQRRPGKVIEVEPMTEEEGEDSANARVTYSDDEEANWTVKMGRPH
ncbi:MAG: transposase [bacterium]|nr:transposase [bacterium]